jgi:transcriptional regulator with XRE-family HTH domain
MYVLATSPKTPGIFYGMPIGDVIKTLRKAKGLTQAELAAKLGTLQKVIADYETGRSVPPTNRLIDLAKVLEASADELLGIKEIRELRPTATKGKQSRRLTKIQNLFEGLKDEEQRVLLKQIESLSMRKGGR